MATPATTPNIYGLGEIFRPTGQAVTRYPETTKLGHLQLARASASIYPPLHTKPTCDPVHGDFLVDEPTAMERLKFSRSTMYRWRQKGKLEAVPMQDSDMVRYRNSDIDAIIQARRQKAADYLQRPIAIAAGRR